MSDPKRGGGESASEKETKPTIHVQPIGYRDHDHPGIWIDTIGPVDLELESIQETNEKIDFGGGFKHSFVVAKTTDGKEVALNADLRKVGENTIFCITGESYSDVLAYKKDGKWLPGEPPMEKSTKPTADFSFIK